MWRVFTSIEIRNRYQREKQEGQSALSLAVFWRQKDAVKALLEKEADINSSNGSDQNTPLHMATFVADAELVELLLEYGANPLPKILATKRPSRL